jgi:hypothetical protein
MITADKILYATISDWQMQERVRRDDFAFDAYEELGKELGYKSPSILRKMCESRLTGANSAKIGIEDALIIMTVTKDYRLLEFMRAELVRRQQSDEQLNLFIQPLRTL